MQFNKPPEWGKRFSFPENIQIEYNGKAGSVTSEIAIKMAERYEDAVVNQIAMEAKLAGVADCTVLNKAAILEALNKQIPKKPIRDSLADRACPVCDAYIPFDALNDRLSDAPKFCKHCGQALDWEG